MIRVTIRHRYSAIEKLIAYFSKRKDFFPKIRSLVVEPVTFPQAVKNWPNSCAKFHVALCAFAKRRHVRVFESAGRGICWGKKEISSRAIRSTSSI